MCEWIIANLNWICPLIITILFSALNVIVAISNLKIAKQQGKMQNDGFCFQLYEKRLSIYESADKILCSIVQTSKVSVKDITDFTYATRNVKFLFGEDMAEECDAIGKFLNELRTVGTKISHNIDNQINDSNHEVLCDREYELLNQLPEHKKNLSDIVSKYISFSEYKTEKQ